MLRHVSALTIGKFLEHSLVRASDVSTDLL